MLIAWALLNAASGQADSSFSGRVVAVLDGDSITVLADSRREVQVRLAQIDAPEHRQDYWQASKQSLSALVFGQRVTVEPRDTDRYGRTVGRVRVAGTDANLEQVRRGMAWVYRQYASDPAYFSAEDRARAGRLGLWSQPHPVPPWQFRHAAGARSEPDRPAPETTPECGAKRRCAEMATCEEARFYLGHCGLKSLDRDRDGIPCEGLC